jgi:hypothetical protein
MDVQGEATGRSAHAPRWRRKGLERILERGSEES